MIATFLVALWLQAGVPAGSESVRVDDRVEAYRIEGATSIDLREQMLALGPLFEREHRRYPAQTRRTIAWRADYQPDGTGCRLENAEVSLATVTTLPEWVDASRGAHLLQEAWANFMVRLRRHEDGHRDIGMQAALTIRHAFDTADRRRDCTALQASIDTTARDAIAHAGDMDWSYDESTRHGETQGAQVP